MTPYLEGKNHSNDSKFLIRNLEGQKEMVHFERAEIKELSTQILYPEKKKNPPWIKVKSKHYQIKENQETLSPADLL